MCLVLSVGGLPLSLATGTEPHCGISHFQVGFEFVGGAGKSMGLGVGFLGSWSDELFDSGQIPSFSEDLRLPFCSTKGLC